MGTSGVILPPLLGIAASTSSAIVIATGQNTGGPSAQVNSNGPWTPPQYALPALTILTVPASSSGNTGQAQSAATNYVFDGVLRLNHRRSVHKTQHPVLTGANIADHAYNLPTRVTLEVLMSDAMAAYATGVWVGAPTKSVSAWQIIKGLMINKTLLTLTTRLDTYSNMLVIEMDAPDDNKTKHGLRASFVLEEIVAGSVSSQQASSSRPQSTNSTPGGTTQSSPVSSAQQQQNVIPSTAFPNTPTYPQVPGAGNVSSNSLGQVPNE